MDRLSGVACAGVQGLRRIAQWTQEEVSAQRQRVGGYGAELRPRKRVRREHDRREALVSTTYSQRHMPLPTQPPELKVREPVQDVVVSTPTADSYARRQVSGIVLDSALPPSAPTDAAMFTGATVAGSLAVNVPTADVVTSSGSVVYVTASPSASSTPKSGMSGTTEAVVISTSIAGSLIIVTLIVLLSCCYRKRKRRQMQEQELAMGGMPRRMKSSSTMLSDGWQSESSEPEKQSLIYNQTRDRSRSVSPSTREPLPNQTMHVQQRSLGGARVFMDTIPESPTQPPSPTSVYTKKSPPQPNDAGQLQVQRTMGMGWDDTAPAPPLSPMRPAPLRLRQGSEGSPNAPMHTGTMMISPKTNMFSSVRLPFMSGAPSSRAGRRSSTGQSIASSTTYDEERALSTPNRRTMESETLPAAGVGGYRESAPGYRDSLWSVAASSIKRTKLNQSSYGDSMYGGPAADLRHTRTNSTSSGGHSRIASSGLGLGVNNPDIPGMHGRSRSHSSVWTSRAPSQALIPALPSMPARFDERQTHAGNGNHKSGLLNPSVGSLGSMAPPGEVELKGRLHSVDFWAREERDMRLGTFAPAELEGSGSGHPTPILEVPTPLSEPAVATPRDSKGMAIGAAITASPADTPGARTPTNRYSNPYFAGAAVGAAGQGGYSVSVQGGDGPVRESTLMPQGYSHESTDDGRRLWNRGRSRSRDRERSRSKGGNGRESSSTVATVFKQHPGDMVMI